MSRLPAAEDFVKLYTDGACSGNPGPGGWAFILEHPASGKILERFGAEPNTTNNRMEIEGALRGLEILKRPCRVELVTDSQYLAKGINEWLPGWRANGYRRREGNKLKPLQNDDLWRAVDALLARHQVRVVHVRGHAGHPQNERCDQLAVAAYKALGRRSQSAAQRPAARPEPTAIEHAPIRTDEFASPEPPTERIATESASRYEAVSNESLIRDEPLVDAPESPKPSLAAEHSDEPATAPARKPRTPRPRKPTGERSTASRSADPGESVAATEIPSEQGLPAQEAAERKVASSRPAPKKRATTRKRPTAKSQPEMDFADLPDESRGPARWDPDDSVD